MADRDFEVDPNFDENAPIGSEQSAPHPDLEGIEPEAQEAAPTQEQPWDWKQHYAREVEYNAAGKVIKEPFEMVLKRASQGYDYAQKVGEWNKKEQDFTGKLTQAEQRLKEFEYLKQVDDYARQNPQWKQHIDKMWEQRDLAEKQLNPDDPVIQYINQKIDKLMEPINNLSSKVTEFDQFTSQQRISKEDEALESEIKSIREKHADLDWETRDEFGKNLELKILEHAAKLNIGSSPAAFRLAFKDFNHDELLKRAQDKAKEQVAEQAHRLKKAGFIGKSSTPQTGITQAKSLREKSYDDLMREGLEELGIN